MAKASKPKGQKPIKQAPSATKRDYRAEARKMGVDRLLTYIENEGKKANTRLRALEKADKTRNNAYRWVSDQLGKNSNIKVNKDGNPIFKRGTNDLKNDDGSYDKEKLISRFVDIMTFNDAKTSTLRGISKAYKKSYETFKEHNPDTNISYDDYIDIFETSNFEAFKARFGSAQIVKMVNNAKDIDNVVNTINAIEDFHTMTLREVEDLYKDFNKSGFLDSDLPEFYRS